MTMWAFNTEHPLTFTVPITGPNETSQTAIGGNLTEWQTFRGCHLVCRGLFYMLYSSVRFICLYPVLMFWAELIVKLLLQSLSVTTQDRWTQLCYKDTTAHYGFPKWGLTRDIWTPSPTALDGHWTYKLARTPPPPPPPITNAISRCTFPVVWEWRLKSVRSSSSEAAPGLSILFPRTRIGAPDTCSSASKPWRNKWQEQEMREGVKYTNTCTLTF